MYELKQGSARLVYALASYKEYPAAIAQLAHALNYDPEQLRQDIQALQDYREQMVSLEACKGYTVAAAEAVGLPGDKKIQLTDALGAAMENMTVSEAEAIAAE